MLSIRNENLCKDILNEQDDSIIIHKYKQYVYDLDNYNQNNKNNSINKKVNNQRNSSKQNNNITKANKNNNQINNVELNKRSYSRNMIYYFY